ncbi:hypothetical protein [Streptomyces sp. 2231.1]|uniref:hypothetical protein n=1 Tax=Streptomyces sp. 2231.1 TaxID=1855347 RepID=UPI000ABD08CC|nr:hypothetical protein [Streptomyces sp. 2231.1]
MPVQQLLARGDDRLIAWGCDPEKCSGKGEFHNQLLLVTIGSGEVVPLSGSRRASADHPGRWTPVFSSRRPKRVGRGDGRLVACGCP